MNDRTIKRRLHILFVATTIVIILLLGTTVINNSQTTENQTTENSAKEKTVTTEAIVVIPTSTAISVEPTPSAITKPQYKLNLNESLQNYTYELAEACPDVDYEIALSILYSESKFDDKAKNVNRNGSIDRGIAQINSDYTDHYAEVSGYGESFDPYNPEMGIKACVYKLQTLADTLKTRYGITDKATLKLYTIESYHRGILGYLSYIDEHGTIHSDYSDLILQRESELLSEGEIITK